MKTGGTCAGAYLRTIKGSESPAHLEEAFQLIHLLFKTR